MAFGCLALASSGCLEQQKIDKDRSRGIGTTKIGFIFFAGS
jgi:hypothetical protein